MSKFLTPPIWYDKNGNLNEMLTGYAGAPSDIAIGSGSVASGGGVVAIGRGASATGGGNVAIGNSALASGTRTIAIGDGANASGTNIIQLGGYYAYTLRIGNGRMSLYIGSTAEGNWVSATSDGISQGLYLVRYGVGTYINTVYLMAPITVANPGEGTTAKNDWYFPFYISPMRINTGSSNIVVANSYYLKVDKNSPASSLQITPGYYRYDSGASPTFVSMSDGDRVMLFKIL